MPSGRLIASTGSSTPNNFLYSGEQYDPNLAILGLYNLRARYYNQATGRFWARDPVWGRLCCGLSWNPYIYVRDDAINGIDPKGLEDLEEESGGVTPAEEAIDNLKSIEKAQGRARSGADRTRLIDSIQKSDDKVRYWLRKATGQSYDHIKDWFPE